MATRKTTSTKKPSKTTKAAAPKSRAKTLTAKTPATKPPESGAELKTKTKTKARTSTAKKSPDLKQATTKGRRKVSTVVHMTRDASIKFIDSQRTIWLAGLGALAKITASTGIKGEQAFEALVKAGEKLEAQGRGAIDSNAKLLKLRINDASKVVDQGIDTVGDALDARVKQALKRLGYPKKRTSAK